MPESTVYKILWTHLRFKSNKYQLLQHITAQNKGICYKYCSSFVSEIEDQLLTAKTVFIDQDFVLSVEAH